MKQFLSVPTSLIISMSLELKTSQQQGVLEDFKRILSLKVQHSSYVQHAENTFQKVFEEQKPSFVLLQRSLKGSTVLLERSEIHTLL